MATIKGIDIEVQVGNMPGGGSRDPMYLGIYGVRGGREYAFNIPPDHLSINTANQTARFRFGDGCCKSDKDILITKECSNLSESISLDDVQYVYLRKLSRLMSGSPGGNLTFDDDFLQLQSAIITLCDATGNMRRFKKRGNLFFAYECGLQHWIPETQRPGCLIRIDLREVVYQGHDIGNDIKYKLTAAINGVTLPDMNIPEHHFNNGGTEPIYDRYFTHFIPGCCNFSGQLKLTAYVTEVDTFINDDGHEDEEYNIVCGGPAQNFEIKVYVRENNNQNKTANFTLRGTITTICQG